MDKARKFLEEYVSLCRKYGFCLVSDDLYEPIVLSRLDGSSSNSDEVLDDDWVDITYFSFNRVFHE